MNNAAQTHETPVTAEQATSPPTARTVKPRIQRPKPKLHFYAQTERLTTYTVALAQAMGLPAQSVSTLEAAAALHDVGRDPAPERRQASKASRRKQAAQTAQRHPQQTAELVANLHGFAACVPAILYHHEHYDGSGYPEGLKGEKIPLEARILAVTDWFSELTTDHPNRPAMTIKEALTQLRENAGTRFDPAIVTVFVNVIDSGIASAARQDPGRPRRRVKR